MGNTDRPKPKTTPRGTLPGSARRGLHRQRAFVGVILALAVLVVLVLIVGLAVRRPGTGETRAPAAPANPFTLEKAYVNPLEGRETANPFYVNPFAQFRKEG